MKKTLILAFTILSCLLPAKAQKSVDEQIRKLIISTITINNYYVDSVNTEKLVEDAIRGMIEKLDPHSAYSTAEQTNRLNEPLQGSFDGIRAMVPVPVPISRRVLSSGFMVINAPSSTPSVLTFMALRSLITVNFLKVNTLIPTEHPGQTSRPPYTLTCHTSLQVPDHGLR